MLYGHESNGTKCHPAIITHVHSDQCVNLTVFLNGNAPMSFLSVYHFLAGQSELYWDWPVINKN